MNISIVGHVCIDKNTTENATYTAPGGPAIFMYKIFSILPDVQTTIITPYGNDFLSVVKALPLFPKEPTGKKTLAYENTMIKKKRIQKAYNRENAMPIVVDDSLRKILEVSDILFITPIVPNFSVDYVKQITQCTSKNTLKVLLPQGYYRDFTRNNEVVVREFAEAAEILPLVDMIILSEEEGPDMLSTTKQWSEAFSKIGIVTLGENGAVAFHHGKATLLPTKPVPHEEVVDSVGSGDIFSASFAYGYKVTNSLEKAGKFANEVARECLFYTAENIQINTSVMQGLL